MIDSVLIEPGRARMDSDIFSELADLALERTGQILSPQKTAVYEARLMPLLRRDGFSSVAELLGCIRERDHSALLEETVGYLAPTGGDFFSDPNTLDHCISERLVAMARDGQGRKLRIWCAGVGNGQEAYSLAILLSEVSALQGVTVELLATDINAAAIQKTRNGIYSHFEIQRGLSAPRMLRHFRPLQDRSWQALGPLRNRISVRVHSLLESAQGLGRFDMILCRRVLSTMASTAQTRALQTLSSALLERGCLVTGEGERIAELPEVFASHPDRTNIHLRSRDALAAVA